MGNRSPPVFHLAHLHSHDRPLDHSRSPFHHKLLLLGSSSLHCYVSHQIGGRLKVTKRNVCAITSKGLTLLMVGALASQMQSRALAAEDPPKTASGSRLQSKRLRSRDRQLQKGRGDHPRSSDSVLQPCLYVCARGKKGRCSLVTSQNRRDGRDNAG